MANSSICRRYLPPIGARITMISNWKRMAPQQLWSSGQKVGATIRLTWPTPQTINRIALYDRPNENENALKSQLTFSDGTTIEVGPLPNDGKTPAEVRFAPKTVSWVEWKSLQISDATENIGLGEFAVFPTK